MFQHTAARRRLVQSQCSCYYLDKVSTHSRPKAAGAVVVINDCAVGVSTHSRPKAAGPVVGVQYSMQEFQHTAARRRLVVRPNRAVWGIRVSTHSRPKAAGMGLLPCGLLLRVSTHSRPKAAGRRSAFTVKHFGFQHTAARRRLVHGGIIRSRRYLVSTHSRPKAAGSPTLSYIPPLICFNTQPPEGGWYVCRKSS